MLSELATTLASSLVLRARAVVGERVQARGRICVRGSGTIVVGDDVKLDGRLAPIELHAAVGATIILGPGVRVEGGVSIEASSRVEVGSGTVLHAFCKVLDNHFHQVSGDRHRSTPPSNPVVIGDACDVGWRAIVLPGARLGDGVRALPGVVVSRRVPAGAVIGGSPPVLLANTARR